MKTPRDLVYYPDSRPGIRRERRGRGFSYVGSDGTRIDRGSERTRLEAMAVPPAYEDVWMSPRENGHLQATGRDTRTRKQYRYHEDWTAYRARRKYAHLADFGAHLPAIRRRILADLKGEAGDQDFAVAAVLALIDRLAMRVGHPDYVRENRSFGATTLRARHLELEDATMRLDYRAKGGTKVRRRVKDATLNRAFARLDDLPGAELVSWLDEDGTSRAVTSEQVNGRIAEITGEAAMTAKTFRTWTGSVAALEAALAPGKVTLTAIAEAAAARLHNTPAIARSSYIHPKVIDLAQKNEAVRMAAVEKAGEVRGLRQAEARLLHLLGG